MFYPLCSRILDDYLAAYDGIKTHLIRRSQPSKLMYIGELLNGRTFSPKMVSFSPRSEQMHTVKMQGIVVGQHIYHLSEYEQ